MFRINRNDAALSKNESQKEIKVFDITRTGTEQPHTKHDRKKGTIMFSRHYFDLLL